MRFVVGVFSLLRTSFTTRLALMLAGPSRSRNLGGSGTTALPVDHSIR